MRILLDNTILVRASGTRRGLARELLALAHCIRPEDPSRYLHL